MASTFTTEIKLRMPAELGYGPLLPILVCAWLIGIPWGRYQEQYETCYMVCPPFSVACDNPAASKLCRIAECTVCVDRHTLMCSAKEQSCTQHTRTGKIDPLTELILIAWTVLVTVFGIAWTCYCCANDSR